MVDVDSLSECLDVVLLGSVEVTHLHFQLQSPKELVILLNMVSFELFKSIPLQVVHRRQVLSCLNRHIQPLALTNSISKYLLKSMYLIPNSFQLSSIACWLYIDIKVNIVYLKFVIIILLF